MTKHEESHMIKQPLTNYFIYRALIVCVIILGAIVLIDDGPSAQEEAEDMAADLARIEKQAQEEYTARAAHKAEQKRK
jgi:uncharacterized membrane protein